MCIFLNQWNIRIMENNFAHATIPIRQNISVEMVAAHCRPDHLSPHQYTPYQIRSNYSTNFSLPKLSQKYDSKEKQPCILKSDSTSRILPSITNISQSQATFKNFKSYSLERLVRNKESQSNFKKMSWALIPSSIYQKEFGKKEGLQINITNRLRINYNNLEVFHQNEHTKSISCYQKQYKQPIVKNENREVIALSRDHISVKNNTIKTGTTQYQRRYDFINKNRLKQKILTIRRQNEAVMNKQDVK